jgi:hypothetical protein
MKSEPTYIRVHSREFAVEKMPPATALSLLRVLCARCVPAVSHASSLPLGSATSAPGAQPLVLPRLTVTNGKYRLLTPFKKKSAQTVTLNPPVKVPPFRPGKDSAFHVSRSAFHVRLSPSLVSVSSVHSVVKSESGAKICATSTATPAVFCTCLRLFAPASAKKGVNEKFFRFAQIRTLTSAVSTCIAPTVRQHWNLELNGGFPVLPLFASERPADSPSSGGRGPFFRAIQTYSELFRLNFNARWPVKAPCPQCAPCLNPPFPADYRPLTADQLCNAVFMPVTPFVTPFVTPQTQCLPAL